MWQLMFHITSQTFRHPKFRYLEAENQTLPYRFILRHLRLLTYVRLTESDSQFILIYLLLIHPSFGCEGVAILLPGGLAGIVLAAGARKRR